MNKIDLPSLFKIRKSLGPLEFEVMKFIWDKDRITVRKVLVDFQQRKPIAYTTVMTVMDNLYKKGFLTRQKIKKSYLYYPAVRKEEAVSQAISGVLHNLATDYGKIKVLSLLIGSSFLTYPRFRPVFNSNLFIATYRLPIGYGLLLTLSSSLLMFSSWDLFQNLQFFGTFDYLKLALLEPSVLFNRFNLFISAFWESLPIVNLLTALVSLGVVFILAKKLSQLANFKEPMGRYL